MSKQIIATCSLAELRESATATISIKTAAEVLGLDPRTVSSGVKEGTIPAVRLGRRVLIPREKFLKLFEVTND